MLPPRATGLQLKQYARPFDQNLGSPLIYLFYMYATIRQKYMVFFHLIFLFCTTIRTKIRVLIDLYFFYVYATIRPKYIVLFHLFFPLSTTIRPKIKVHTDLFLYMYTTIRPKIRVFIDIFLSFAHDHSTKIYDLLSFIYSFFVHDHSTKKQGPH